MGLWGVLSTWASEPITPVPVRGASVLPVLPQGGGKQFSLSNPGSQTLVFIITFQGRL